MRKLLAFCAVASWVLASNFAFAEDPEIPKVPQVEVRFAYGPYADGSYSVIGSTQGWFDEVGIKLVDPPHGVLIDASQWSHLLVSGGADISQNHTKSFTPVLPETTEQRMFVLADMSLGNAIIGDPKKYKSLDEFIAGGASVDEAYRLTMEQLRGKTIPTEINPAGRGLLSYAFSKAGMNLDSDVNLLQQADSSILAMISSGQSDVVIPSGIPTVVQLILKGYKPIITNAMAIRNADLKADSRVLLTTLYAGIASTKTWLEANHDTALRFASVYFRIFDEIVNHPDAAVAIHLPFLNGIAGTNLGPDALKTIYSTTQPFRTFEQQAEWYNDASSPFYWMHPILEDIKFWESEGMLPHGKFTPRDISVADEIYHELAALKTESEAQMLEAEGIVNSASANADMSVPKDLLSKAHRYHDIRDYLDAANFARAAVKWANYRTAK
jgi:ABC-type nitrate/sulfonate/bicarbonate transport system substrate-binding protein